MPSFCNWAPAITLAATGAVCRLVVRRSAVIVTCSRLVAVPIA